MRALVCKSGLGSVDGLMREVGAIAGRAGVDAAVVSKEALFGISEKGLGLAEHLSTSGRMEGARLSKSVANEFLLWLAKERQVSAAIGKMGARDAKEFGIIIIGDADGKKSSGFESGLKKAGIHCARMKFKQKTEPDLPGLEKMAVSRIG